MLQPKETLKNINIDVFTNEEYKHPLLMKLDANENYLGPSPKVLNSLERINVKDLSLYPSYGELYKKIAEINDVNTENIALTSGTNDAVRALICAYMNSEDKLQIATPTFLSPEIYTEIEGASCVKVPYAEKWIFPESDFLQTIDDKTKIILLTNPNDPTGELINQEFIEKLLQLHPQKLIIINEAYTTYANESFCKNINKYDNVAIIRSFSKDYGLAGLRIGYILANENIVDNVKKILAPYPVNNIATIAAIEAMNDKRYMEFVKKETERSKQIMTLGLEKLKVKVFKSYANFILADFAEKVEEVYNLLKENNILVKNFFNNDELKSCLRITIPSVNATRELLRLLTPKDTLVFDLDGVLVDVNNSSLNAVKQTYENFTGQTLSYAEIQNIKSQSEIDNNWNLTHHLICSAGFYMPYERIVEEFQKLYWNNGQGLINNEELLVDRALLNNLSKKYTLAIFTDRTKQETEFTLDKFKLKQYFSIVISANDLPKDRQKPDTLGLDIIKKELCPLNMYYLSTTTGSVICAKNYNIFSVGVLPPSDKSDGLKDIFYVSGADYVINNINEIEAAICQQNEKRQTNSPY